MFGCQATAFEKFFQVLMSSDFASNSRKRSRSMNNCSKYKNKQFSSRKQSNSSDYTHLALFYLMNFFKSLFLNSLSPKSDQHEISPYYIHASENRVVMRIGYMIREEESN